MRLLIVLLVMLQAGRALAQEAEAGGALFAHFCAACHGMEAEGDGPMAGVLLVKPANLTQLAAKNGGAFPFERVAARIDGRNPLVSHGSEMPVYGWLFIDEPTMRKLPSGQPMIADRPVADLIAYLETIQR
jgi:mono/diheme cytochrome c family protein